MKAALLTIIVGVLYGAIRIAWQLRYGQRSAPAADFVPNQWQARNPGYYGGTEN